MQDTNQEYDILLEIEDIFTVTNDNKICNIECTDEMTDFMQRYGDRITSYVKKLYRTQNEERGNV